MSKQIDTLKRIKYKQGRKAGKSRVRALKDAGYSIASAEHHSHELGVVKCVEAELKKELKAKDITVDWLIKKTVGIMHQAETQGDFTNQHRGIENIGRFVGVDKSSSIITNVYQLSLSADTTTLTTAARRRFTSLSPENKTS